MGLNGVISNLLSLGAKLLPALNEFAQAAPTCTSSSSPALIEGRTVEAELEQLMRLLQRIRATLYDADGREIVDNSVKLWLKELKQVAYDAEDVLDDYHYEILRDQVDARDIPPRNSHKRKQVQMSIPDGMLSQIKRIKQRFQEIEKHRIALRLSDEDGTRCCNNESRITPTSHFVVESEIIGREREKEELVDLLSSECKNGKVVSVVAIVGIGGLGKTTLAQLAYNDQNIRRKFNKFGWVCVSEDFNVQRLTRELLESITGNKCDLINLDALQEKISNEVRGQRVLLVLDDVWNEKITLWESFRTPFMSATSAKILITTRNKYVAQIMQTMPTFNLSNLSEEQCWKIFQHYAFSEVDESNVIKFVEIGKKIMRKCGMLPLAIKSIASLLRHEAQEESWREILESALWKSDARNEVFPSLQISYTRLPTYLKSCFLYCSMFPKNYRFSVEWIVKMWHSQGYIESNEKQNIEKIGLEYAKELWQRSFFEGEHWEQKFHRSEFQLHDMIHDLARKIAENECFSIEASKVSEVPHEVHHLHVGNAVQLLEPPPCSKYATLRTLIIDDDAEIPSSHFNRLKAKKLRALKLGPISNIEIFSSFADLKHLRYLSLSCLHFQRLPENVCSLYNLQYLTLRDSEELQELPESIGNLVSLEELFIYMCSIRVLPTSLCQLKVMRKLILIACNFEELPASIGNLVSLKELVIKSCSKLRELPVSLCRLKTLQKLGLNRCEVLEELPTDIGNLRLQTLEIIHTKISCLPHSLMVKGCERLRVWLTCETIGWLKDFVGLDGTLCIEELGNKPGLTDNDCANLVCMHKLRCLVLSWCLYAGFDRKASTLSVSIKGNQDISHDDRDDLSLLVRLQPHSNIRELHIAGYCGKILPEWVGNPKCASPEKIVIHYCENLKVLPFGSLRNVKYMKVSECSKLRSLPLDSLPPDLQELQIIGCKDLRSVPGIKSLKSLVRLHICDCENLRLLMMDADPSTELMMCTNQSSCHYSHSELRNLTSLRSLRIERCPKLQLLVDELHPVESWKVEVIGCPGLKKFCLERNIAYKVGDERCFFDGIM